MSINMIVVQGRLGKNPEMRYTPAGKAVTTFSVATDRTYSGADGVQVKETTWFRAEAWGKLAESCNKYLVKGNLVTVIGRMKNVREFPKKDAEGNPTGVMGNSGLEISANEVKFNSPKPAGAEGEEGAEVEMPVEESIEF